MWLLSGSQRQHMFNREPQQQWEAESQLSGSSCSAATHGHCWHDSSLLAPLKGLQAEKVSLVKTFRALTRAAAGSGLPWMQDLSRPTLAAASPDCVRQAEATDSRSSSIGPAQHLAFQQHGSQCKATSSYKTCRQL